MAAARRAGRTRLGRGPDADLEADLLLARALDTTREWLLAHPEAPVPAAAGARYAADLEARAAGCPVAYLTGVREFHGRPFAVRRGVFIPRPETEILVEVVVAWARGAGSDVTGTLVDVCTGSGCVAVTLALELGRPVVAVDRNPAAVALARDNAARLGAAGLVRVREGDLLAPLAAEGEDGPVAAVVANPPYVPREALPGLPPDVRDFEPRDALDGGPGGLDTIRRLVAAAGPRLAPGGLLAFELDPAQAGEARALLAEPSWRDEWLTPDLAGRPRVAAARRAP